eukprot:TRINITY_DN28536_c0_g1_i2.p1 TRINITY_DN28536_c0_g1~~TRINITY_DN28536_c0_g1_i2.p1  ORF type:complete len:666 (+),score=98.49 TRINITY_DN28536_c0_g1_i2:81-2000(+)
MDALRCLIRDKLRGHPLVARAVEDRPELQDDPSRLLQYLEERGLIEDIFATVESSLQETQRPSCEVGQGTVYASDVTLANAGVARLAQGSPERPGDWQMCLRLIEGQAFLDFLDESEAAGRDLTWHMTFGNQRCRTRSVAAAVVPRFDEAVFLKLPAASSRSGSLLHAAPIHMVLICSGGYGTGEEPPWDPGSATVLCSHLLEWRHCLTASGPLKLTIELQGIGRRKQLAVGVLHAELELRPQGSAADILPELAVAAQLRQEEQRRAEVMRRSFEEMDRWWAEHHALYPARNIRLFAQTESCLFLPIASFVVPLEAGRALDGPGHALRWVSLLPVEPAAAKEASAVEPRWHTFPALWARGRASPEERALLLCSLLLGYSLDAWCCLGADAHGRSHAWVMVRDKGDSSLPAEVCCWDPQQTSRFTADDARYLASYSSVDTVFNNRQILICHAGALARTSFDFSDPRSWVRAPLDDEALDVLRLYPSTACPRFADLAVKRWPLSWELEQLEEAVEQRIAGAVRSHREAAGLATSFDSHIAQLLQVALANYESERTGAPSQASTFEMLAKRVCGPAEVLRALPVQFNHLRVSLYWPAMVDRPAVREVLAAPPSTTFAVRARIALYPEGAVAAWILLAAKGRM